MINNKKNINKLMAVIFIIFSFILFSPHWANAATINLFSSKDSLSIGDEFTVDLKIDSENIGINAAQTTLQYSKDLINAVSIDKTDSAFNFWLAEPSFDNSTGTVSLIGGSSSGLSGKSLEILSVVFKVIGSGTVSLTLNDAAVTASDGSGTNVLTATKGLEISSLSKAAIEALVPKAPKPAPEIAPNAPAKPILSVPLYPNPLIWNDVSSNFVASWNLPKDVIGVSTSIDKIPTFNPIVNEGIFDNKSFPPLGNGVWYLHVRFKNNIGWGATNHYRIAVDSLPPVPFKINIVGSISSDNPTPTINFESKDQFSGNNGYSIQVDGGVAVETFNKEYTLPNLTPGKHVIKVTAKDNAGNTTESYLNIETLPIQAPEILFINRDVFTGEGGFFLNGDALSSSVIIHVLKLESGESVFQGETTANEKGFWSISVDQPLKSGSYFIEVTAKDSRGALSLPVKSEIVKVTERPVINFFGLGLTKTNIIFIIIVLFLGNLIFILYLNRSRLIQTKKKVIIAERDISHLLNKIEKDLNQVIKIHGNIRPTDTTNTIESEVEFLLKKICDNISKAKDYVLENINDI